MRCSLGHGLLGQGLLGQGLLGQGLLGQWLLGVVRVCELHLWKWRHFCWLMACPSGQPREERIERVYCYSCCASQERINMSAIPTTLQLSFQPLSSHLAYPGFSERCEQDDQWYRYLLKCPPRAQECESHNYIRFILKFDSNIIDLKLKWRFFSCSHNFKQTIGNQNSCLNNK